ncbi:M14 family metallopeptidase [Limnovirga soli]|uniref:Zinc carboxypeptidase n=1 Tax=Limnovirga soli TaxID=2656915 RepID=A0A8J8FDN4_9BACT|nr:M14 family metallopeptidase [Limnovirga soli]NNV54001.1 zinc carboxypeptidase [Limnovirga soli]
MKKLLVVLCLIGSFSFTHAQTVPSPEQFLGYKVGTHFTRHYQVLNYFAAVAAARPDMIKLQQYGATNEGRPLMVAFIATPEHLKNLESIRLNNLRLAGLAKDKMAPVTDGTPAIVWFSYNVHGNEPASSEASMLMLYALVEPNNTQTAAYLKNTVVVIDPCINPDGRDRYVNWFNNAVGTNYNADPSAREHMEPWPQGRSNHYNFDLNRDWAWQTQVETQQRMQLYNAWLPQVHVDYHEQGYNEPYYFAPAAEPYHDVITPWQRDFQTLIGKNNARYFDANGWLFFTKERFDLLYPSYGDTYPIYNGGIGMTFEQGGIRAGLGIRTSDGDTLTLVDRAQHHFTTGISTLEVASKNADKLITEYKKFFDNNRNAVGSDYKTYVLTAADAGKLQGVADLLQRNGIEFGTVNTTSFKGYNYFTGKEETYSGEGFQLAITAYQSKSKLLKVLFEPKTYISDSATYDITAWSIPYAYGVKAYGVKERLDIAAYVPLAAATAVSTEYGLLLPYKSLNAAKALSYLLQHHVKVRFNEKPFTYNGKNYDRGTLIVLKTSNVPNWKEITNQACSQYNIQADAIATGMVDAGTDFGSPDIKFVKAPKVALLTGNEVSPYAAGEIWNFFDQSLHYPITQIMADNLGNALANYDVIIMPDGYYGSFDDKNIATQLRSFLQRGGKIIALEGGVQQLAGMDMGITLKKSDDDTSSLTAADAMQKKYANRERDDLPNAIPGAIFKAVLDNTHPLAFGYPDFYYTLKQDGKLYDYLKGGWNVGVLPAAGYVSGFVGSKLKPTIQDGLVIGATEYGNGNIVFFADDIIFRMFWENGKLLLSNAVFLVGMR